MFLVYINDIGGKLLSLSRLLANDTSLGYASQDEDQIKYVINHDLHFTQSTYVFRGTFY
jgi:hypothetical protein